MNWHIVASSKKSFRLDRNGAKNGMEFTSATVGGRGGFVGSASIIMHCKNFLLVG